MTTITAIVPTFNRSALLAETLDALEAQTRTPDAIIVWDDGSQDGTEAAMQARVAAGSAVPLRYHRAENAGKSRSLNEALRLAKGDLIWICDDDDLPLPHAAATLSAMLAGNPTAGAAAGGYRRFRDDPATGVRNVDGPGYWPDLSGGSVLRHLLEDIFLFQPGMLVRRACYDAVGPFREDLPRSIDYDMVVRLAAHAPIAVAEEAVFLQRKHDGDRGPAAHRHAAGRSEAVWRKTDRTVFAPFRDALPMRVYAGMFEAGAGVPDDVVQRAALLQRGTVFARRLDWAAAVADFAAAVRRRPDLPLSAVEIAICRRAMAAKHGCDGAMAPEPRAALRRLAREGRAGADVALALARGTVWRVRAALRARRWGEATRLATFASALWRAAGRGGPAGPVDTPILRERTVLPAAARVTVNTAGPN